MKSKIFIQTTIFCLLIVQSTIYTQLPRPYGSDCGLDLTVQQSSNIGTFCKPESITKYTNVAEATFPTLVVFVQFKNDPGSDAFSVWPQGEVPIYLNTTIARFRNQNYSEWWEAYSQSTEYLSDFWMEVSRGALHVTGQAFHIELDNEMSYYQGLTNGIEVINSEVYTKLQNEQTLNWLEYDQWGFNRTTGQVTYGPDGYIDMLYKVHRYLPPQWYANASLGHSTQGENFEVYDVGGVQKFINGNYATGASGNAVGSGFQIDGKPVLPQWGMVSFAGHEHGHYLFQNGHQYYSKVNNDFGMEEFFSPYDLLHMGWFQSKKVNYANTPNYSIGDFSSRNNQSYNNEDEILEVPINGENEFFLIVNRQKVSTYDKIMWGDTAKGIPYSPLYDPSYGKGIYIYHAQPQQPNYPWPTTAFDQECADGLWDWEYVEDRHPDWSCQQWVPYYRRTNPVYTFNDPTNYNTLGQTNGLQNRDGKSVNYHFNEGGNLKPYTSWFSLGETPTCELGLYTDKFWTNLIVGAPYFYQYPMKVTTNREWQGDRWDAWKIGYNEVFSPYSSPSTANWSNQYSGVFIYLESQSGEQANFKIYKTGEGGMTETEILALTPPAKPMNLKNEFCFQSSTYPFYYYNKLTWNHNLEEDMRRPNGENGYLKRYNIYKVASSNMTDLPDENNYTLISTVDIDETEQPSFVDYSEPSGCNEPPDGPCPPICWVLHAVRYRVEAVDVHNDVSVKSDFASGSAYNVNQGGRDPGDNPFVVPKNIPGEFSLLQNYPNPFNPSTEIKFELPQNTFVTLKVYNAVGQVVAELVNNEYKNAGRYSVSFNGTNLASGIYFYSIEAGVYKDVKKMVLIK